MSICCSRIAALSALSYPFLRHHSRRSLSSLLILKHLSAATSAASAATAKRKLKSYALSAGNTNNPTATLTTTNFSSRTLQTLSFDQKDQISLYVTTLLQWNQKMNLTASTEEKEVMTRHVEDSLALLDPLQRAYRSYCSSPASCDVLDVVDVGSGAGLPGLIFAIACPSWKVTLVESMQKRCSFLEHIVALTGLSNVQIVCERAEKVGRFLEFREHFDVAVARAVAEMRILAEYCVPLVRVGGLFVAAKGHDPQEEVKDAENAIHLMGASIVELCTVDSHSPLGQRTAVVCVKDHPTPKRYPRETGTPAKHPL